MARTFSNKSGDPWPVGEVSLEDFNSLPEETKETFYFILASNVLEVVALGPYEVGYFTVLSSIVTPGEALAILGYGYVQTLESYALESITDAEWDSICQHYRETYPGSLDNLPTSNLS